MDTADLPGKSTTCLILTSKTERTTYSSWASISLKGQWCKPPHAGQHQTRPNHIVGDIIFSRPTSPYRGVCVTDGRNNGRLSDENTVTALLSSPKTRLAPCLGALRV